MGGGPAGEEASRIALETLDDAVGIDITDVARLASAVSLANRRIFESSQRNDMLNGMGTTLTSAVIFPDHLLLAHVGDSRAYQILSDHVVRLTIDHSVAAEMQRAGGLTSEEAEHHPNRNVLTRVVGPFDRVRIDVSETVWHATDRLLLCTDGLSSVISDEDILEFSLRHHGLSFINALIDLAVQRGGKDDITVVLAEPFEEPGDSYGR